MESKSISVGVIGAGIQGVCISLFLLKKGFIDSIVQRKELKGTLTSLIKLLTKK